MTTRFMTIEQRTRFFEERAEALRGIFKSRINALDAQAAEIDRQKRRWRKAETAIDCAEQFAEGLPGTAAGMLDAIASDAGAVCEFYDAEERILDEADAQADDGFEPGDDAGEGAKSLGVGEVL